MRSRMTVCDRFVKAARVVVVQSLFLCKTYAVLLSVSLVHFSLDGQRARPVFEVHVRPMDCVMRVIWASICCMSKALKCVRVLCC